MNDLTSGQDVYPAIAVEAGLFNWSHDFRLPLGIGETLTPQPSGPGAHSPYDPGGYFYPLDVRGISKGNEAVRRSSGPRASRGSLTALGGFTEGNLEEMSGSE